ncbi:WASH complex subunit 2-like isoform X2 [Eriocheir sinensis]|uniref:WASH complex subunit 2-like isoform X1 n=1 Tax=Eriocheir sinensis TaxID=95602 RepID=UPI0021C88755|nr:WASH complex subunit 2-like isoform X1 [Eriocheir sinensis]XP_050734383.1 WASH complex subunit 2-like isoform X2 [Eriocheir sinensis]
MGSSGEGGGGREERWWENPKLSPADLRQHSETWSLADDAAMATLLQSISQRLVSRTHEVEEALERVLEDTDCIVTNIANTNNAFHMLANTQFIENRTYQDDADIAREKQETSEKPPVTEEDILGKCRTAIEDGLSLVTKSYERHEIQDSDSDDDDTAGSPVPVYALIDPYESKPLPLIIGTEGFLADDKVGLEISSSEENSRMTFSPDDTESEEELEDETDRVTLQQRAIPASSSRALDDDSDSEWSGEDGPLPEKIISIVGKQTQPQLSSEEEDDEMFVPSSRNSKKVGNIFSSAHNAGATIPTVDANKRTGVDSDSEDEGLFGKEQKSSGLFIKPKLPPQTRENTKPSLSRAPDTLPSSAPSNPLGVENVRAMPHVTPTKVPVPSKPRQVESNLFDSDSDDGDLFSKKPAPSEKVSKVTEQNLGETQATSSGGLFSSDEDSPLFSGLPQTQGPGNTKEDNEEPPPKPKESGRKVPVGGVNIFGAAITSALRRQHSSDAESSDKEDDTEPDTNSNKEYMPPQLKPDDKPPPKVSNSTKVSEKGGLFESDDEDNLFETPVKKPVSGSKDVAKTLANTVPSLLDNNTKTQEEKDPLDNEPPSLSWKNDNSKSTMGLFSDDDDDLFGIPTTTKKNDISVPGTEAPITKESPPKITPVPFKSEESAASRPTSIFASPPECPKPSEPVNISEPLKTSHSLFSSPSDDDDDLFSSLPKPIEKKPPASAFMRDPPPLPPQSSAKKAESFSKGPTPPDMFPNSNNNKSIKVNREEKPKETSSLFGSLSDEEDIFSPGPPSKNSQAVPSLPSKEETDPFGEPQLVKKSTATESCESENQLGKEATEGVSVFPDESPNSDSNQSPRVDQSNSFSKGSSNSFSDTNNDIAIVSKEDDIFNSTEDDLFDVTKRLPKTSSSSLKEDSSSPLTNDAQLQTNSKTSPVVSEDAVTSSTPRSLKDDLSALSEKTSDPVSVSSSPVEPDASGTEKPKESVVKPPVGGVALFIGKELDAQINKQKTLLKTVKNKNKQNIDDIFGDMNDFEDEDDDQNTHLVDDDSSDELFGISSGQGKSQRSSSVLLRQSPPLLPEEIQDNSKAENDLFSIKQKPPEVQEEISQRIPIKSDDEPDRSPDSTTTQQDLKSDKPENLEEGKETKEISPRKKPPVGGVSVFGGSAMRNNELFAKVLQRKSMLACESDSSEEDAPTEPADTAKPLILPTEKGTTVKPLILPTEKGTTVSKSEKPVSPVSPHSIYPPVFSPDRPASRSGGDEDAVSFDDPATQSNVLQSLNKTRARGSLKRRPPSRAHRKKASDDPDPSDAPQTSMSPAMSSNHEHHTITVDTSKTEPNQPAERLQDPLVEKDQRTVPVSAEQKEVNNSTINVKTSTSSKASDSAKGPLEPVGASTEKKKKNVTAVDSKDFLEAPNPTKSGSKVKGHSLFDGSDSDEDLFGEKKQKKAAKNPTSAGSTTVPKMRGTKSKSHSLFEDDDDVDIFSSKSQVTKTSTGAARSISVTKPKGNLKQSSEPFEDPLFGNLKK